MAEQREFYVLSLKHTREGHRLVTWWRPDDKGYTWDLRQAGRYTEARITRPGERGLFYYNSGCGTVAVLCADVDALAERVTLTVDEGPREFLGVRNHVYRLRRLFRAAPLPFDRPQHADPRWAKIHAHVAQRREVVHG